MIAEAFVYPDCSVVSQPAARHGHFASLSKVVCGDSYQGKGSGFHRKDGIYICTNVWKINLFLSFKGLQEESVKFLQYLFLIHPGKVMWPQVLKG